MPRTNDEPDKASAAGRWRLYAMLVGCMALWGGTWPVGRVVAQSVSPASAALLRFLMATMVLIPICLLTEGKSSFRFNLELLPRLLVLGATGIFGYSFLFFAGLKTIPSARAALIVGCIPVCIAVFSSFFERRWPRLPAVGGILLSLTGVSVVIAEGNPLQLLRGGVRAGDLMILGCVLCWTAYTVFARPVMRVLSPLVAVTCSCLFGSLMLLPFALADGLWSEVLAVRGVDWAGLAYLGIAATSLAYYGYYRAIQHVGAVASGVFINLVPVFAVILGCVFLHESLRGVQMLGGVMVIAGVLVTVRANRWRA